MTICPVRESSELISIGVRPTTQTADVATKTASINETDFPAAAETGKYSSNVTSAINATKLNAVILAGVEIRLRRFLTIGGNKNFGDCITD
jgi:hypothetical protein